MNPIIIYYSRSGNTERIALQAQKGLGCDVIKIVPQEAYGNYIASCLRVTKEKRDPEPPAFLTPIPDLSAYDTVLLGYPIWAQDLPQFVAEFVKRCDLSGKTVVPFATYGMSGINWTMKHLEQVCQGAAIRYPFDSGVIKKGDYKTWIEQVRRI